MVEFIIAIGLEEATDGNVHQIYFLILFEGAMHLSEFLYTDQVYNGIQLQRGPLRELFRKLSR
jgi:hypothetical protein